MPEEHTARVGHGEKQYRINQFIDGLIPVVLCCMAILAVGVSLWYDMLAAGLAPAAAFLFGALAWIHSWVVMNGGWNGE